MSSTSKVRSVVVTSAVLLALAGAILVRTAFTSASTGDPVPVSQAQVTRDRSAEVTPQVGARAGKPPPSAGAPRGGIRDLVEGPVLPQSRPVRVEIPRIGVTSPLVELGLDEAGAMEVPQDPALAGWYTRGPAPGALGPAVIAGHVSWDQAPAVFFRLGTLRRGDRVLAVREDGTTAVFAVSRVATFPKTRFPTRAVFGSIDHAGLRLITCGGDYDAGSHRFLHNVVVFARLVTGP